MPLIQTTDLARSYQIGEITVPALRGVGLAIERGEFVAVMGPSGSGKSTFMNLLGCLDVPSAGTYHFKGIEVTALDRHQRARLRREWIGFVFQGFNLLERSSALENVELPLLYRGVAGPERRRRALHALEQVGLADRAKHLPKELSGGQQQRVAIARAIITQPELLLADEPTGNLDSARGREVMELLRTLNQSGQTLLMVTHEADMADYTKRVLHFRDGRIERDEERS